MRLRFPASPLSPIRSPSHTHSSVGGKPSKATYDYASSLLFSAIAAAREGHSNVDLHGRTNPSFDGRVYMVGDNPQSDIAGANGFGWESILVRTGVFRGKDESEAAHKPTVISKNVLVRPLRLWRLLLLGD